MTIDLIKKYKQGNIAVVVAHIDSEHLTYRGVDIPHIVPLYAAFDVSRHVGSARLIQGDGKVYVLYDLNTVSKLEFGLNPPVVLAVSGAERVTENGTIYLQGGAITAASVVQNDTWEALYGKGAEDELAADRP